MTIDLIPNGSFELPWTDLLPWNNLTNQVPAGFSLFIRRPGTRLVSAGAPISDDPPVFTDVVVVPECVHKLRIQLPDADELILDGDVTYKVFSAYNPFSVDLAVWLVAPAAGRIDLTVPVQVHQHGDGSPGAAVWRLVVNGVAGDWLTFGAGFVDRTWTHAALSLTVSAGQVVPVMLQMEGRALAGIDFFTDRWQALFTAVAPEPEPVNYVVVANLLPQDTTEAEFAHVLDATYQERQTILYSADDAARLVAPGQPGSYVRAWDPERWTQGDIAQWLRDRGVSDVRIAVLEGGDDEPEPDPEPQPVPAPRYVHNPRAKTRLGMHVLPGGEYDTVEFIRGLAAEGIFIPTVMACYKPEATFHEFDGRSWLHELKRIDPGIVTFARYERGLTLHTEAYGFEAPVNTARAYMHDLMPKWAQCREWVDYWVILNEQIPKETWQAIAHAEFERECMRIAEENGYHLGLFGYSVGTPEPSIWDHMKTQGVFAEAAAGGHVAALHEYGWMPQDWSAQSVLGRFTDLHRYGAPISVAITEYSIAENAWGAGITNVDTAALMAQFAAYDARLRALPEVIGAHIFTWGDASAWWWYDCLKKTGLRDAFRQYLRGLNV